MYIYTYTPTFFKLSSQAQTSTSRHAETPLVETSDGWIKCVNSTIFASTKRAHSGDQLLSYLGDESHIAWKFRIALCIF